MSVWLVVEDFNHTKRKENKMEGRESKKRKISIPFVITILIVLLVLIPKTLADENDQLIFTFNPRPNRPPTIYSGEYPGNGSVDVELRPYCKIQIDDPDGQAMNIYWYDNSSGSWVLRRTTSSVYNGTYYWTFGQAYNYLTTYYWKVVVSDGSDNTTAIYHFTTEKAPPFITPPLSNLPPVANITGPLYGYVHETIVFYGNDSYDLDGYITGYRWDFDNDGLFDTDWSNLSFGSHIYNTPGNYTVKLQVIDNLYAMDTDTCNIRILPLDVPLELPVPKTNGPYEGFTNETVFFNSTGSYDPDGTIVNYTWNFGDNNISYLPNTTHVYRENGTYMVTLTVRDNDNLTNSSVTTAVIEDRVNETEEPGDEDEETGQPLLIPVALLISAIIAYILVKNRLDIMTFLLTKRRQMIKKKIGETEKKTVKPKTPSEKPKPKSKPKTKK